MVNFFYNKPRFLIRGYKYFFQYDRDEIKYVIDNLAPGDVAIDIGAHKGAYTYWMRRSVKAKGKVLSIEPQPILFEYLKKMMLIFGYSNVKLMDCAVSENDSEGEITVPGKPGNISQGARIDDQKIVEDKHQDDLHTIKVKIRTVDSIVAETGIKPKIVKIDVEGHEFSVIRGMKKTLTEIRPNVIIECEARHIKEFTVYDVFNFLLDKDYEGYYFQKGQKKPLSGFELNRDQLRFIDESIKLDQNYVNNFIFEPN